MAASQVPLSVQDCDPSFGEWWQKRVAQEQATNEKARSGSIEEMHKVPEAWKDFQKTRKQFGNREPCEYTKQRIKATPKDQEGRRAEIEEQRGILTRRLREIEATMENQQLGAETAGLRAEYEATVKTVTEAKYRYSCVQEADNKDGDYAMRKCLTDMEGALAPEGKWSKPIDQWTDEEVTVEGDKQRQELLKKLHEAIYLAATNRLPVRFRELVQERMQIIADLRQHMEEQKTFVQGHKDKTSIEQKRLENMGPELEVWLQARLAHKKELEGLGDEGSRKHAAAKLDLTKVLEQLKTAMEKVRETGHCCNYNAMGLAVVNEEIAEAQELKDAPGEVVSTAVDSYKRTQERSDDFLTDQKKRVDDVTTRRRKEAKELLQLLMECLACQEGLGHQLLDELKTQFQKSEERLGKAQAERREYEVDGKCPEPYDEGYGKYKQCKTRINAIEKSNKTIKEKIEHVEKALKADGSAETAEGTIEDEIAQCQMLCGELELELFPTAKLDDAEKKVAPIFERVTPEEQSRAIKCVKQEPKNSNEAGQLTRMKKDMKRLAKENQAFQESQQGMMQRMKQLESLVRQLAGLPEGSQKVALLAQLQGLQQDEDDKMSVASVETGDYIKCDDYEGMTMDEPLDSDEAQGECQ